MALIDFDGQVVVIVGGVGGAKLAHGLAQILAPEQLTIIVNTGDDFWHYGLKICPDIDTVLYTLAGRVHPIQGWGLADETTTVLDTLASLGEDPWFRLGDKDLATHLLRTQLLREGRSLTAVIAYLAEQMHVGPTVLPMTDDEFPTIVETEEYGALSFQEYFVRYRWQPLVKQLRFPERTNVAPTDQVYNRIGNADVILFGPSNPWLSITPVLTLPGMTEMLQSRPVPRIAVTPIVRGKALKGPAARLMADLGYEVSAEAVARYYSHVINGFVYDHRDNAFTVTGVQTFALNTIMTSNDERAELARQILEWLKTKEMR